MRLASVAADECADPTEGPAVTHRQEGASHSGEPRAQIQDLNITFQGGDKPVNALRGVTLDIRPAEILALVGESGSGKSVMGLALLGLLQGVPMPTVTGRVE